MSDESEPTVLVTSMDPSVLVTSFAGATDASTIVVDDSGDALATTPATASTSTIDDAGRPSVFSNTFASDASASAVEPPSSVGTSNINATAAQPRQQLPSTTSGSSDRSNQNLATETSRDSTTAQQHLGRRQGSFVRLNNHVRLDLGGGRGVVSVPLHRQTIHSSGGVTTSSGSNGSVNVRVVQVDPLVPQPIPDSYPGGSGFDGGVNRDGARNTNALSFSERRTKQQRRDRDDPLCLQRFKCDICYEYLRDPVGCGKCSSRFCLACLDRVFKSEVERLRIVQSRNPPPNNNNSDGTGNGEHPRCPTCRQGYERIVFDRALFHEINHGPTLPCRYDGCREDKLKLSLIAEHEQSCGHAPVRCRYAGYGCSWAGKRCLVKAHELYGCKVAPMGSLIDQFRNMKADHGTRLEMVAQQAVGSVRMNNVLRQNMARDQMKSISDIFSMLQYCQVMTCATPHFLFTKDKWAAYWRSNESRAAVINVLSFAPFLLASFGSFSNGSKSFFHLLDILAFANKKAGNANTTGDGSTSSAGVPTVWNSKTERLSEDAFIGFCAGLLGILAFTVNFLDTKSSISWSGVSIRRLGNPPIMCDLLAVSTFTLLLAVMEYHEAGAKAFVLWLMVALCSTFFPALILTLSHSAARGVGGSPTPTAAKIPEMARSVEPLMFGLRFSLLATYFGMAPCLDAVIIVGLLPRGMLGSLSDKLVLKDCFLEKLPRFFCVPFLGAKLAVWTMQLRSVLGGQIILTILRQGMGGREDVDFRQQVWATMDSAAMRTLQATISESILATKVLLLMNFFVYSSFHFGIKMGNAVASSSQASVRLEGVVKDYNFLGILSFAGWAVTMALILQI